MNDRAGGWRTAGVIVLLLTQAALAAFLGFLSTVHFDEARRLHSYEFRSAYEFAGGVTCIGLAVVTAIAVFLSIAMGSKPPVLGRVHLLLGRLFFIAAIALFFAGVLTPRIPGSHTDLFPGLGFWIEAITAAIIAGCAWGIRKRAAQPTIPSTTGAE